MIYETLLKSKNKGIPCMMVTVVEKTGEGPVSVGKKMLVPAHGNAVGTVGGGALEYEARELCARLLKSRENRMVKYSLNEGKVIEDGENLAMACGGTATLFFEYIGVKAEIFIFGGGHVGQALCNILKTMNYYITVIDDRQPVIEAFCGADQKYHQSFTDYINENSILEGSYVIVCTPSHQEDYNVLDKIIEMKLEPKYLGMLCSRKKLASYLERTYEKFGKDVDFTNFYSPIGLDIGGGSPEEIAVSISAEILAIQYNKTGHNHMRGDYV